MIERKCLQIFASSIVRILTMTHSSSIVVISTTQSSFLTPDRLEKLNSIGFVWSVRGESQTPVKAAPESKAESATGAVVDEAMAKGEEKVKEEAKKEKEEGKEVAAEESVEV